MLPVGPASFFSPTKVSPFLSPPGGAYALLSGDSMAKEKPKMIVQTLDGDTVELQESLSHIKSKSRSLYYKNEAERAAERKKRLGLESDTDE